MKLRGATDYSIGLDIGTGSVGWAVVDDERQLLTFKGKPTWGSRLFGGAETAAETRVKRGLRRRYDRRRQRLNLLQGFFAAEIEKVDPEFFIRLNQARLLKEDRAEGYADYRWPLFNDADFNESDYYNHFPTIYHLRKYLTETDEQADIRLIYLALHNIVKHRGNFLYQDQPSLSAKSADVELAISRFVAALKDWCEELEIEYPLPVDEDEAVKLLKDVFDDQSITRRGDRRDALTAKFCFVTEGKADKAKGKEFANAMLGYKANFTKILDGERPSLALSDEEKVAEFLESCPEEFMEVFESLQMVYSSFVLMGILKNADGGTISACKVNEYEQYGKDLAVLKELVREYAPDRYDRFFRGPFYKDTKIYDASKAEGYTKYDLGPKKSGYKGGTNYDYDAFKKDALALFKDSGAEEDERYEDMAARFEEQTFLRRLKTSDNGSIPFQLHLEEMSTILEKQGAYYPFLAAEKDKIQSLVSFRIPYYVGPLTTKSAAVDAHGNARFAWSERIEGMENEKVYPWNWDQIIDKSKSAEKFIQRMTGTCTYLYGAPVLPKCSLLYEEFCVLNELNGVKWSQDGDREHRFSYEDRADMMDELFKVGGNVSHTRLIRWLEKRGRKNVRISGTQGETGFVSKLGSYSFFRKLLGVEYLSHAQEEMVEEIILWNTLFEDRAILKEKIAEKYGDELTGEQIAKICRKRFSGWGRLSEELLCGIKASTDDGKKSIMDILREGDPNNTKRLGRAMNLMEILHDATLQFEKLIDKRNREHFANGVGLSIDEMQGSPALRRAVNQALKIVDEIVGIAGDEPTAIYIESTRDEDERNKGDRAPQRYNRIKEALEPFKKEDPDLWNELLSCDGRQLADKRLALYFIQRGKCMYTGDALYIDQLSSYQVDHILPQSLIKDDSIENLALVKMDANQSKTDRLTLDHAIIKRMRPQWKALFDAKLIGKKKYENLIRTDFSEGQIKGFIARQLVETSQIIKFVQQLLAQEFPHTKIVPVKASVSADLKGELGLVKCREANDYHHAHDAYLACCAGSFINIFCPDLLDNPVRTAHVVKALLREHGEELKKTRRMPGSPGFIVSNFMRDHVDNDIGEVWDHKDEAAKIRRSLDFKSCYISRMPFELTGTFWDQTIYSPRHMMGSGIPLKAGLDPMKYGSYSREQFAYFFVYRATGRRGAKEFVFAPVPVSIAARVKKDEDALDEYAKEHAAANGKEFLSVAKRRIPKYQLIEYAGNRFFITGNSEVRNATQISFSVKQTQEIVRLFDRQHDVDADDLYSTIRLSAVKRSSKSSKSLGLSDDETAAVFGQLNTDEQADVIMALLNNLNGVKNQVNLTAIGKGATAGQLSISFSKAITAGVIMFVDQSVTGMFERKYRLEL